MIAATKKHVRSPRHAGVFYPENKHVLLQQFDDYLSRFNDAVTGKVKAVIAPHAGYDYSGGVAGRAYAALKAQSGIRRIAIFAPNHQTAQKGGLISSHTCWQTPLGDLAVDREFMGKHWSDLPQVVVDDEVCQAEYSVEVQLPFIQQVFPDIPVAPMLLGECKPELICEILRPAWEAEDTLIVISSDLYHYLPREQALPEGMRIARTIEHNDYENITAETTCGYVALQGLMRLIEHDKHYWRTLCVQHSGQANRFNLNELVGYGAFLLMEKSRSSL